MPTEWLNAVNHERPFWIPVGNRSGQGRKNGTVRRPWQASSHADPEGGCQLSEPARQIQMNRARNMDLEQKASAAVDSTTNDNAISDACNQTSAERLR
jgi:hypothetical protein